MENSILAFIYSWLELDSKHLNIFGYCHHLLHLISFVYDAIYSTVVPLMRDHKESPEKAVSQKRFPYLVGNQEQRPFFEMTLS